MRFSVQHAQDAAFEGDGLRSFFEYRDLGIDAATDGKFHAQVIRAREACTGGTGRHTHALDFQMVYVLNGWVEFEYEGRGLVRLEAGACVHQPPGIAHELLRCSDDCELLEITSPAAFETHDAPG
ncbi:MAG: cupin domain-containing protein [Marivibrio sp.]|uniref:cupin domain-containing protein n=1 Tax=Marivibrio sp. TaxID=2039719 RepID=UPI0032ED0A84